MSRMIKVTKVEQLPIIDGIDISFQVIDKKIEAVVIQQDDKMIRIVKDGTYTDHLAILVKEEVEYATTYSVSGERNGEVHSKKFSNYAEAEDYELNLQMDGYHTDPIKTEKQKVKQIGDE